MAKVMKGVLYDKRIELEEDPGLPSGTIVAVKIEPKELSLKERRRLVRYTGGKWKDDISLGLIFDKIIEDRLISPGREVNLDDSA